MFWGVYAAPLPWSGRGSWEGKAGTPSPAPGGGHGGVLSVPWTAVPGDPKRSCPRPQEALGRDGGQRGVWGGGGTFPAVLMCSCRAGAEAPTSHKTLGPTLGGGAAVPTVNGETGSGVGRHLPAALGGRPSRPPSLLAPLGECACAWRASGFREHVPGGGVRKAGVQQGVGAHSPWG